MSHVTTTVKTALSWQQFCDNLHKNLSVNFQSRTLLCEEALPQNCRQKVFNRGLCVCAGGLT